MYTYIKYAVPPPINKKNHVQSMRIALLVQGLSVTYLITIET